MMSVALPTHHHQTFRRIEHLPFAVREPVACQHVFRCSRRHAGKNRPASGQPYARRPRQVENVIAIEE